MHQEPSSARPLVYISALTAAALCTIGVSTAQGASADRFGPVSRRVVVAALPRHGAELAACYAEAREGDPDLETRMVVSFVVTADGEVTDVAIPTSDRYNPVLESCVKGVVDAFTFYPTSSAAIVNAPLVFRKDAPVG